MKELTDKEAYLIKHTITRMERNYMQREPNQTYFANEDLKQDWSLCEVNKVKQLWKKGFHINKIAAILHSDPDEVFLLLFDLARNKHYQLKINQAQLRSGNHD